MNIAFIPVRGGSKSIPLKNIMKINNKPLVYWTIKAACECRNIDIVYVSTDSKEIRETVEKFSMPKVKVIGRSEASATDTASTEFVMLEFAEQTDFDTIVLIQATSPLLSADDLERGFEIFLQDETDSVLSVVRQKRFHWTVNEDGIAYPMNYDVFKRPRRQEFEGYLVENGAFYITSRSQLLTSKNRVSGKIKVVEMSEDTYFEIDEPSDWTIIEALMAKREVASGTFDFPVIKMFLTDCDGCLTDGGMYYSEFGDEMKKFNTKDGMGFSLLREKNIITGIITGEDVKLNQRRADKLKLDILEVGCKDKLKAVEYLAQKYGIKMENIAYVGDDLNDLEVIQNVGLGCCPADANDEIKKSAAYVSSVKGGEGVIREIVDLIYKKNKLEDQ